MHSANTPALERLPYKIGLDPYYGPLLRQGMSLSEIIQAGFIDDGLQVSVREHRTWNPGMLTTALMKARANLEKRPHPKNPLVLLSTGAFSPVHVGHLNMMQRARAYAEEQGYSVLAGYLSASHDSYVSVKAGGAAALHAESRIALLEEAVFDSDWLCVCPWEARYAPIALNFTDVLDRLQRYLDMHLRGITVQVAYVFGRDNLKFLDTFTHQGIGFCVPRTCLGGYEGLSHSDKGWFNQLRAGRETRIHLLPATSTAEVSSSHVRSGATSFVPKAAQARYLCDQDRARGSDSGRLPLYMVRQDLVHGTSHWLVQPKALSVFFRELCEYLAESLGSQALVEPLDAQGVDPISRAGIEPYHPTLSLDVIYEADACLSLSRKFDVGGQVASHVFVARPGHAGIEEQLRVLAKVAKSWPATPWRVVDDDESLGATRREVTRLLDSLGLSIKGFEFLNKWRLECEGRSDRSVYDVVDARDFLLGAEDGGLVIELPDGALARAPYMLPFVNAVFRAKIPPERIQELSESLWHLNVHWFEQYAPALTVADAAPGAATLLEYLGFSADTRLSQCCRALARWSGSQFRNYKVNEANRSSR